MTNTYNKEELLNLLSLKDVYTVYSVIGRMEVLIYFFDSHPPLSSINPFLKTYYFVTKRVAERYINDKDTFEDFDTLEKLDILFASRFFTAVKNLIDGERYLKPWYTCFEYCLGSGENAFLKMLLGINAHINGDLALSLFDIKAKSTKDFLKINEILLDIIPTAMKDLAFHDKDIYGLGAYLFNDLARLEFEKTVVVWRNNAWKQYQMLTEPTLQQETAKIHDNTERIGKELMQAFTTRNILEVPAIISKINKVRL